MKGRIHKQLSHYCKCLLIALFSILFASNIKAQVIAFYPLTSSKAITGNTPSGQAWAAKTNVNVSTGTATVGSEITANGNTPPGSYHSQGIEMKTSGDAASEVWPSSPDPRFTLGLPLSPKAGFDIHLTKISFTTDSAGESEFDPTSDIVSIQPFFQVDGTGPWVSLASAQTVSNSTPQNTVLNYPVNNVFYSGHTYVVAFFFFTSNGATKEDEIYIDDVVFQGTITSPPAGPITVTTGSPITIGKYSAIATGSYSFGSQYYLATQSGIVYSTSSTNLTTAFTTITTDGANGIIRDSLTGLSANTKYYVKAYAVTQFGTQYGLLDSFTTAPYSAPIVTINLTSVLSNKAQVTGNITDSGGLVISEKGFVWNTTGSPTINSNNGKLYEGSGTASFTDFIKSLKPNTHYCARAYAINSLSTTPGYSNDTCFTTGVAQPTLTALPGTIDFGQNFYGSSALILSYTLTGSMLDGSPITIKAPPGFIIATSAGSLGTITGNTITLTTANTSNYNGSTLAPTPIYIEMPTSVYGTFSGNIIHSGGGITIPANADMVALTGSVVQSPIDVSNSGTDFWLGFGFEQDMQQAIENTENSGVNRKGANLYVNISGTPNTQVTVEMPLLSTPFTTTVTIPASGFVSVTGFPQGSETDETNAAGLPDSRLYYTGVTNRGIHVYSHSGPISVWLYDYATNSSAGGALVFPTNTWNSNYTVQAYGNTANNGNGGSGPSNSYFFVIAQQDNTPVYFTPTVDIIDSTTCATFTNNTATDVPGKIKYAAGSIDTVYLNAGQVFNALGGLNSSLFGMDLSGTTVRTDCDKKIAVFGGNGRCVASTPVYCPNPTSGSDNMIQQMVPSVAWDTKYFTVPTKSMERNLFRIYVKNAATQVWINDTTHTKASSLLTISKTTLPVLAQVGNTSGIYSYTSFPNGNGGYYAIESSFPMDIESDQPINVIQYLTSCSGNSSVGDNGSGDPEMIILTGAQQAINSATVYSPIIQNGASGGAYINIVIPKAGVSTFNLDNLVKVDTGSSSFTGTTYGAATLIPIANAFQPYPTNPNYYYAKFHVGNGTVGAIHTMSSSVPFNGIAYGCASGESYGFNAGTQVKNLSSVQFTNNPNGGDSSATAVRTCVGNSVTLKIALPYLPSQVDSLVWNPQSDPRITTPQGTGAITGAKKTPTGPAVYDDSIQVNGRTFYVYSSPVQYTFNQLGTYRFPVTAYGKFTSDCPGEDIENMLVIVGHDQANLAYTASCGNPTVVFTTDTIPMAGTNIIKTIFDFGDGNQSINHSLDTSHTYGATQLYTAKVTTYNSVGCISTDSVQVDFAGGLVANYTKSTGTVCAGSSITFTDNSTASGISGTPNKWIWNYGDGSNLDSSGSTVSHPFTTAGKYIVRLTVKTTANCSDVYIDSVSIQGTPVAAFTATSVCLGAANTFTNKSSVPNNLGTIDSAFWSFGDGIKDTTLGLASATHIYATAGNYTSSLYVKSDGGCISTVTQQNDTSFALPVAGFTDTVDCATLLVKFTDTSKANGGTIIRWDWDLDGNGTIDTTTHTPSISFKHPYPNGNGQTYKPTLTITTLAGCSNTSPAGTGFTIGVAPVPDFTINPGTFCMPAASVTFNNTTTISDGTTNQMSYTWHFADGSATADSAVAASAPGTAIHTYNSANTFNVSITAKSNKGCTATSATRAVTIHALPVATIIAPIAVDCLNDSLAFSSNATSGSITVNQWKWNFADTHNDVRQNPNHQWATPGTYNISLVETSIDGCKSDSAFKQIEVDTLPTAGFSLSNVDCTTQTVTLIDTSNGHGRGITEWDWDFGDGTPVVKNSVGGTVRHTYTNGNGLTFTIKLTVTTKIGCTAFTTKTFTIGASPVAKFSPASTTGLCLPNASVTFNNTTTISDGSTNQLSYNWHFGDGSVDVAVAPGNPPANATHIYTTANPDTVILTVTSNNGCTNAASYILKTVQPQPVAVITAPTTTCLNIATALAGNKADTIAAWSWNYGDNTTPGTTQAPAHAWSAANQYTISLVVTSSLGCTSNPATASITVNALPTPAFSVSNPTCAKYAVNFTDASTSGAAITNWSWNFGDGATDLTDQNPSHTYTSAANYPVTLHVTDANGCSSKPDKTIQVTINPLPQPGVSVQPICMPGSSVTVNFTATNSGNASVNNASGWQWIFDDGSTATGSPVAYTYTSNGPHSLLLIGTSTAGCMDTLNFADTVYSSPVAKDSIINSSSLCSNLPVAILDESYVPGLSGYGSISKVEIYWNYNAGNPTATPDIVDNAPAIGKQYTKQYTASDVNTNYTIRMNAYSGNGCPAAPADSSILVYGSPLARFAPIAGVCQEAPAFILTQGSQASNLTGSGSYSGLGVVGDSAFDPQAAGPGTFPIVYTFFTTQGCQDTAMQNITVYPTPAVNYGGVQAVLPGDSITLKPISVTGTGLQYMWSPVAYLNTANIATPISKPADSITYTITVTSPGGCSASTTLLVQVLRDFTVPNTFTPNNDGINDKWGITQLPNYPVLWIQVFDRYGQIVYESHGYSEPWDGTYKGKQLESGTYYYIIEMNGIRSPKTGYVTILR